jgi:hypothetical protein
LISGQISLLSDYFSQLGPKIGVPVIQLYSEALLVTNNV